MITKYSFEIPRESVEKNCLRLTNQLWKLIPMREHEEDWHKQLETVINEIVGFSYVFATEPLFLQLLGKLEGLDNQETEFNFIGVKPCPLGLIIVLDILLDYNKDVWEFMINRLFKVVLQKV